ncbi:MAG: ferritin-like domain-containing protein [Rhodovibrionaceae bacterium]
MDDIPWDRFDASKVDAEMIKIIKAASLVEYNGDDYAAYLCNVFDDDAEFQAAARQWASEEVQHGEALGRWSRMADPSFDFDAAVRRFREGYRIPVEATESSRGSRSGELVSRCIVEVGTSSYYGSLAKAAEEPLLKDICQRIASDELRHYKLFYDHLRRYVSQERISKLRRLMVCAGRINETEDDELAYAYFCANAQADEPYNRKRWGDAYMARACGFYDRKHIDRGAAMIAKAAGLNPQNRIVPLFSRMAYGMMRRKHARYKGDGAAAA